MSGELLAKSRKNGGTSLRAHTEQVAAAIGHMAAALGYDPQAARNAALLHDLGKAHPRFQGQIREADGEQVWKSLAEKQQWRFVHRHELSSLFFLPCFPRAQWEALIEMVVAHHKAVKDDEGEKGLLDLINSGGMEKTCGRHLKAWEAWMPGVVEMLREWGVAAEVLSEAQAREAWEYAVDYVEARMQQREWSPLRGLLMAADHFASALAAKTAEKVQATFRVPDVQAFAPAEAGGILFPLSDMDASDPRQHTLLVAPTGAGKTNYLMRRCAGRRIFYTLPFQASINAMYKRFRDAMPGESIRLQHAASRIALKAADPEEFEEEYPLHGLPGAAVKVLTPHQLAAVVFALPGFESLMLDLRGAAVILDEIHTYSDVSRSMVLEIVNVLLTLGCSIHIGTATLPSAMYAELLALLGGQEHVCEVKLSEAALDTYNRHRVYKLPDWSGMEAILDEAMAQSEKVLIVCNTVGKAQEIYERLAEAYGHYPHMLIHSRFRRKDRADKERQLRENFEGMPGQPGLRPCWVVATQVVEVSLDISFDRMITACAPLDALIQRFGRVNRRRRQDTLGQLRPVHVVAPEGPQKPYERDTVRRTFELLPSQGDVLEEKRLQALLDAVYPDLPEHKDIKSHLAWRNGQFNLPPLCNRRASVLLETLEIESAACILESDREAYERAAWDEKSALEIPVIWKVIARHAKGYIQLETGSKPFVVPQAEAEHLRSGLILREYDSFYLSS